MQDLADIHGIPRGPAGGLEIGLFGEQFQEAIDPVGHLHGKMEGDAAGHRVIRLGQLREFGAINLHRFDRAQGDDGGAAALPGEHGHFAEKLAGPQHPQFDLGPVFDPLGDLDPTLDQVKTAIGDLALFQNDVAHLELVTDGGLETFEQLMLGYGNG